MYIKHAKNSNYKNLFHFFLFFFLPYINSFESCKRVERSMSQIIPSILL